MREAADASSQRRARNFRDAVRLATTGARSPFRRHARRRLPDPAPETGRHTRALLEELGYASAQIGDLVRAGGAFVAEGA